MYCLELVHMFFQVEKRKEKQDEKNKTKKQLTGK